MNFFTYLCKFSKGDYPVEHLCTVIDRVLDPQTEVTDAERKVANFMQEDIDEGIDEDSLKLQASNHATHHYNGLLELDHELGVVMLGLPLESKIPYKELRKSARTEIQALAKLL